MKFIQVAEFQAFVKSQPATRLFLFHSKEEGEAEGLWRGVASKWDKSLQWTMLDGEGASFQGVTDKFEGNDLFQNRSGVVIRRAEKMKAALGQQLKKWLANSSVRLESPLVLLATSIRSDHVLYKVFAELGAVLDLSGEKPYERENRLIQWVQEQCNSQGKKIDYKTSQCLVNEVAREISLLENELQKLFSYAAERSEITLGDVQAVCIRMPQESIWQLGEALLKRQGAVAVKIARGLEAEGQSLFALLRAIRSQLQTSYQVNYFSQKEGGVGEIQKKFPYMKGKVLEHHLNLARECGTVRFQRALNAIAEIDLMSRDGIENEGLLMDLLISKMVQNMTAEIPANNLTESPNRVKSERALLVLPNRLGPEQIVNLDPIIQEAVLSLDGLISESAQGGRSFLNRFRTKKPPNQIPIGLLNEHTKNDELDFLLGPIQKGQRWGLVSDAGLPCIADPGSKLVFRARQLGIPVEVFVGPSAITLALMLSGLPGQHFTFHGYLEKGEEKLKRQLLTLEKQSSQSGCTQIFIEAPYRNRQTLQTLCETLSNETYVCIAWDLLLPTQGVLCLKCGALKKLPPPQIDKRPAVFLLFAGSPI